MSVKNTGRRGLPCLLVQHRQVEVNKLQVAGWGGVVMSLQFLVEPFGHRANRTMDLNTHLGHFYLGIE